MTYIRTEKINGKYKFIHRRVCDVCDTYYETISSNKKTIHRKNNWCSSDCRKKYFEQSSRKIINCKHCNTELTLYKSNIKQFCSHICYALYVKSHPIEFNLYAKASKMHLYSNTPDSIAKGINTKRKKGLIRQWSDEQNIDWTKYWKVCNYHTKQMRKQLFDIWDGYDYYTGLYIKNNINLPYYHKDYPTLDHKKPRSQCFKEGLTVRQACDIKNLVWTTRSNNSKKYNKFLVD